MSGHVVIRMRYRVPAAAPEPYNRGRAAWGFEPLPRLMRAILNAARIPFLIRRERDSACRAICADAVVPAGADGRRRRQTIAVRRLQFVEAIFRAPRTLLHSSLTLRQKVASYVAKKFPGVSIAAAHDEQTSEGINHELGKLGQGRGKFGHG